MSEEVNNTQDVKKRTPKKRESTEQYQYVPEEENEQLIMDKPSEPLNKKKEEPTVIRNEKVVVKSNKELYESYIKELKKFTLSINGETIYDSILDKTGQFPVKFENDYFVLYGKKYSYNGLKITKK